MRASEIEAGAAYSNSHGVKRRVLEVNAVDVRFYCVNGKLGGQTRTCSKHAFAGWVGRGAQEREKSMVENKPRSKSIYILFLCDEWKSYESMRLSGVTSSFSKLKTMLSSLAENKAIELTSEVADINDVSAINNAVTYAFVKEAKDGEYDPDGGLL